MVRFDTLHVEAFCGVISKPDGHSPIGMNSNDGKGPRETGPKLIGKTQDSFLQNTVTHFQVMMNMMSVGLKELFVNKLLSMFLMGEDIGIYH